MRWFLLHIILFIVSAEALAQYGISGVVRDENSNPLPGVNIYAESLKQGTVSNMEGKFRFEVASSDEIEVRISMIGFKTLRIAVIPGSEKAKTLELQLESITLQSTELIVSASRSATFSVLTPISATTLKAEDLQTRSILTLDEALQYVPGVQMAGDQVNIRGSSGYSYGVGSRVTLLIDGVPMLGADRGDVRFDGLPMSQIERVEIIKGPGSTLYGSGALSGVINLVTKDFPEKLEVTLRTVAGAYQPVRYQQWRDQWDEGDENRPLTAGTFTIAAPIGERAGFWLNGVYRKDTGWLNALSREGGELYGKFGWTSHSGTNLNVFFGLKRFYDQRFVYWNGLNDVLNPGSVRLANSESRGEFDGFSDMLSIAPTINQVLGQHAFLTIRGRAYGVAFRKGDSWNNIARLEESDVGVRYGADVQYTWQPEGGSELVAGIMYDANLAQSDYFVGQDGVRVRNQPEYAGYVQWKQSFGPRFSMTGGLRYDAYEIDTRSTESRVSPKLNLAWTLESQTVIRASYGAGYRVPSVAERFTANRNFLPIEANLTLKPELSQGFEIGLKQLSDLAGWSLVFDLAGFWNEYQRLVEPRFEPQLGAFQFQNLTEARIRGLELSLESSSPSGFWFLKTGYTLLDTRDKEVDMPLVFRPKHQVQASQLFSFTKQLSVGLDYRYFSAPERMDSDFNRFIFDADVVVPVHVWDGRFIYTGRFSDHLAFQFSLIGRNLANYVYIQRPAYLAPPRSLLLQFQVDF